MAMLAAGAAVPAIGAGRPPGATVFGVNYAELYFDVLRHGPAGIDAGLAALARRGIAFARFPASGHVAQDWAHFEAQPAPFWAAMDQVFAAAERHGIGLIPTLLWNAQALPFHAGEAIDAWADPQSRTRQLAHAYVDAFVARYDRSAALLMYEFTNELNIWVDLPNATAFWPRADATVPDRHPLPADRLTGAQFLAMQRGFVTAVRTRSRKPVSTGNDLPRVNAWHLARGRWDTDSPAQFVEQLRAVTPPGYDVTSIHLYDPPVGTPGAVFATVTDLLRAVVAAAGGHATLVGEFGVGRSIDPAEARRRLAATIAAIRAAGITYAALWNYAPRPFQPQWDVSDSGDRAWQLDMLAAADRVIPRRNHNDA